MAKKRRKVKARNIPYPSQSPEYRREYSRIQRAEIKEEKLRAERRRIKAEQRGLIKNTISVPKSKSGGPLGGKAPKDAAILDNFNPEKLIQPSANDMERAREVLGLESDPDDYWEDAETQEEAEKRAYAMLEDMRYAYGKAGGRKKLVKMIKKDDKKFASMVKDLMKVETALMTAQIRKEGTDKAGGLGPNNFFVVLKGLDTDAAALGQLSADGTVDLAQIHNAFNPESHLLPHNEQEESSVGRDAPPDGLFGGNK